MKPPWRESSGLIPVLFSIAITLSVIALFTERILSLQALIAYKDYIEIFSTLINTIIVLTGGILAYIKYFRGRIFSPKLSIIYAHGCFVSNKEVIHWLDLQLENKGTVPIWNYNIEVIATVHDQYPYCSRVTDFAVQLSQNKHAEYLIDIGETSYQHCYYAVPLDALAVTFQTTVRYQGRTTWTRSITVENCASK